MSEKSIEQALGHARIRIDSEADLIDFASSLISSHVTILERDTSASVLLAALVGPRFCAAHATWPRTKLRIDRSSYLASHRRLFLFVNRGEVRVTAGDRSYLLQAGQVTAKSLSTRSLTLDMRDEVNEILLLSVDVPSTGEHEFAAQEVRFLRDPSVNAFTYASSFGLARAPLPESKEAADALYGGAVNVARTLLQRVQPSVDLSLYETAQRHIRFHASDPSLTAQVVADQLGVSRRALEVEFQARDDAPARSIRRARVLIANTLISGDPARDLTEVAALAGFVTLRRFRDALRTAARDQLSDSRLVENLDPRRRE